MTSLPAWVEDALGFSKIADALPAFADWLPGARAESVQRLLAHGDFARWLEAATALPKPAGSVCYLDQPAPQVGDKSTGNAGVEPALLALGPWRKGPFSIHGVQLDAEWRCFLKWQRVAALAQPFLGRRVLDVGSGNGYYLLRLLGAGAKFALGVEPSILYSAQFLALARCFGPLRLGSLPLGIERLPPHLETFDSVLSMGVLYHRRAPLQHLAELRHCLVSGGELVLETLVVDGPRGHSLVPRERYAQMRNVWSIPSLLTLEQWLTESGFRELRFGAVTATSGDEQRTTAWMPHPSLLDFLNDSDPSLTIEGYPAPARVVVVARAP